MKNVDLTFTSRIGITNFLGQISGPLGKLSAMQRVNDQARFSEAELSRITVKDVGNGMVTYAAPDSSFGAKQIQVEDADAAILLTELSGYQNFRMADVPWVEDLQHQLNGKR